MDLDALLEMDLLWAEDEDAGDVTEDAFVVTMVWYDGREIITSEGCHELKTLINQQCNGMVTLCYVTSRNNGSRCLHGTRPGLYHGPETV